MVLEMADNDRGAKQVSRVERDIARFFGGILGTTEERGYRKWCRECVDWTGHLVRPTSGWQLERCTRCGNVRALKVVKANHARSQRALLASPDINAQVVFDYACRVLNVSCIVRALEIHFMHDVEERQKEIMAEVKVRAKERKQLDAFAGL